MAVDRAIVSELGYNFMRGTKFFTRIGFRGNGLLQSEFKESVLKLPELPPGLKHDIQVNRQASRKNVPGRITHLVVTTIYQAPKPKGVRRARDYCGLNTYDVQKLHQALVEKIANSV